MGEAKAVRLKAEDRRGRRTGGGVSRGGKTFRKNLRRCAIVVTNAQRRGLYRGQHRADNTHNAAGRAPRVACVCAPVMRDKKRTDGRRRM